MSAFTYEFRDGQRMEQNCAREYDRMNRDFTRDTGYSLKVRSGVRTDAEQEQIFRQRYVTAGNVRGRKVYDTRWWNGALWYRISSAGTVAAPGSSNHQESGPNGPRSFDIYDTGPDAGVTVRGSVRDKWMERNAKNYQIENEGYNFKEPWHKKFVGAIGSFAGGGGGSFSEVIKERQRWMISRGFDLGKWGADGKPGKMYHAAVRAYQTYLASRGWYPVDKIDDSWGPLMQAAHDKFWKEVHAPKPTPPAAPKAPAFPLKKGYYFGPRFPLRNTKSVSGFYGNGQHLATWQQQMKNRGWPIKVDGKYGDNTGDIAYRFQKEKGLTADRLIGPSTWAAAWTAPVT